MSYIKACIYLDNSATSRYKPRAVIKAVERELKCSANAGRGGHKASIRAGMIIEECRERINAVTFDGYAVMTKSCTEALNTAIFGKSRFGKIITSVFEHNSVLRPLERLRSKGANVVHISSPSGVITPDILRAHLSADTSLVVLSEMSNVTGTVQPIDDLGALLYDKGIPFIVDAAQSLGHTTSSYKGVSMLAGAGHKGLHGPQGTGFLVCAKDYVPTPLIYGGTGTDSASLVQPSAPPEGLESGTLNAAGIAGLSEGIRWSVKHKESIVRRITELSAELIDGLKSIPQVKLYTDNLNGVVSFNIGDLSSSETADILDAEYGIAVRAGLHCAPLIHKWLGTLRRGAVRASIGVCNTSKDVEALLRAVSAIAARKG